LEDSGTTVNGGLVVNADRISRRGGRKAGGFQAIMQGPRRGRRS
jgi:hypothetical protein